MDVSVSKSASASPAGSAVATVGEGIETAANAAASAAGAVAGAVGAGAKAVADATGVSAAIEVAGDVVGAVLDVVGMVPATLTCITPPHIGFVPLDFKPETITMTRQAANASFPAPSPPTVSPGKNTAGHGRTVDKHADATKIDLAEVIFEGPLTKLRCDTLLTWLTPHYSVFAQLQGKSNQKSQASPLMFVWGPPWVAFTYEVKLTSVNVVYERFMPAGIPTRARVKISMREIPSLWGTLPTNPTSGGLPGRKAHTVAAGESLQSIATANYGTPALWRKIAEVNNIQNPSRVRPGTTIYLPNAGELPTGRPS